MRERVYVFEHSLSFWRQQVNANGRVVVVSVTIASIGDDLPTIVDADCRHQQDLRSRGYQVVEIAHSATGGPDEGMRSTQNRGRDPDYLPAVVDRKSHTEFPATARKRAEVAHPALIGPDEGM